MFNLVNFEPTKYGVYVFPWYMDGLGWCMTVFTVSMIPGVALYKISKADSSLSLLQRVSFVASCFNGMISTIHCFQTPIVRCLSV